MALIDDPGSTQRFFTDKKIRRPSWVSGYNREADVVKRQREEARKRQELEDKLSLVQMRKDAERMTIARETNRIDTLAAFNDKPPAEKVDKWVTMYRKNILRTEEEKRYARLSQPTSPKNKTIIRNSTVPYVDEKEAKQLEEFGVGHALTFNKLRDSIVKDAIQEYHLSPETAQAFAEKELDKAYKDAVKEYVVGYRMTEEEAKRQVHIAFRTSEILEENKEKIRLADEEASAEKGYPVKTRPGNEQEEIESALQQAATELGNRPGGLKGMGLSTIESLAPAAKLIGGLPIIPTLEYEGKSPIGITTVADGLRRHEETRQIYEPVTRKVVSQVILPSLAATAAAVPYAAEQTLALTGADTRGLVSDDIYNTITSEVAEDIATELLNPVDLTIALPFAFMGAGSVAAKGASKAAIAARFTSELIGTGMEPTMVRGFLRSVGNIGKYGPRAITSVPDVIRASPHFRQAFSNVVTDLANGAKATQVDMNPQELQQWRRIIKDLVQGDESYETLRTKYADISPQLVDEILLSAERHTGRDALEIITTEERSDLARRLDRGLDANAMAEDKFDAALAFVESKYPNFLKRATKVELVDANDPRLLGNKGVTFTKESKFNDPSLEPAAPGTVFIATDDFRSVHNYVGTIMHELEHVRDITKKPELANMAVPEGLKFDDYVAHPVEVPAYKAEQLAQARYQEFLTAYRKGGDPKGKKVWTKLRLNVNDDELDQLLSARHKWQFKNTERGGSRNISGRLSKDTQRVMRSLEKGEQVDFNVLKATAASEGMRTGKKTTKDDVLNYLSIKNRHRKNGLSDRTASMLAHVQTSPRKAPPPIARTSPDRELLTKAERKLAKLEAEEAGKPIKAFDEDTLEKHQFPEIPNRKVGGASIKQPKNIEEAKALNDRVDDELDNIAEKMDETESDSAFAKLEERQSELDEFKSGLDDFIESVEDYNKSISSAVKTREKTRKSTALLRQEIEDYERPVQESVSLGADRYSAQELREIAAELGVEVSPSWGKGTLVNRIEEAAGRLDDQKASEMVQRKLREKTNKLLVKNSTIPLTRSPVSSNRAIVPYDQTPTRQFPSGHGPNFIMVEDTPPQTIDDVAAVRQPEDGALARFVDLDEMADEVKQVKGRGMRTLLHDVGFGLVNSNFLTAGRPAQLKAAHQQRISRIDNMVDVALTAKLDGFTQAFTGRNPLWRVVDGRVKNVRSLNPGASMELGDILSQPGMYKLNKKQEDYVRAVHSLMGEAEELRGEAGLPVRSLTGQWLGEGDEALYYVPRQATNVHGITPARPSNPNLARSYESQLAGREHGIDYSTNMREVLRSNLASNYYEVAQKQYSDALAEYAIKPRQIVEMKNPGMLDRLEDAKDVYRKARENLARWSVPRAGEPRVEMKLREKWRSNRLAAADELDAARTELKAVAQDYSAQLKKAKQPQIIYEADGETMVFKSWQNRYFPQEVADELRAMEGTLGIPEESVWKGAQVVEEVGNMTRFLSSFADFGVMFIHGLPTLADNPVAWGRAAANSFAAFADPKVRARLIRDHLPTYKEMARYGIPIGDSEFFTEIEAGRIPKFFGDRIEQVAGGTTRRVGQEVGRQTVGRFQSQYNVYLGYSRALIWEALKEQYPNKSELAGYIKNLTGGLDSAELGIKGTQRGLESVFLAFSPKLLRSTIGLTFRATQLQTKSGRRAFRSLGTLAAGAAGIYIAAGLADGRDWEEIEQGLNPLNGKRFMSYNVNGDWIGVGGQVRSIAQLMGAIAQPALSETGLVEGKGLADYSKFGDASLYDNPLLQFYASRGATGMSVVGGGLEGITGEDFLPYTEISSPSDYIDHIGTSALPFAVQGALEGERTETILAGLLGMRTSAGTPVEKAEAMFEIKYNRPYNPESPADRRVMKEDETLQAIRESGDETLLSALSDIPGFGNVLLTVGANRQAGDLMQPTDYEVKKAKLDNTLAELEEESGLLEVVQKAAGGDSAAASQYGRWRADYLKQANGAKHEFYQDTEFGDAKTPAGAVMNEYWTLDPLDYIVGGEPDIERYEKAREAILSAGLARGDITAEDIDAVKERDRFISQEINDFDDRYRTAKESRNVITKSSEEVAAKMEATPKYVGLTSVEEVEQVDQIVDTAGVISALVRLSGESIAKNEVIAMLMASGAVTQNVGVVAFFRATAGLDKLVWNSERDQMLEDHKDDIEAKVLANPDIAFMYKSMWDKMDMAAQLEWIEQNPDKTPPGPTKEEEETEEDDIYTALTSLFGE